jgi:hypothetical protein
MPAEIKCLLCRRETALTCSDSVGYPRSREEIHHSHHVHQCYRGEQCTREGQKTPPGNSGRPHVPRGHNAVPSWERLHLFHRAVSNHNTTVHCSVGSFSGNCSPREPSLKSTHEQLAAKFLNQIAHEFGLKSVEKEAACRGINLVRRQRLKELRAIGLRIEELILGQRGRVYTKGKRN